MGQPKHAEVRSMSEFEQQPAGETTAINPTPSDLIDPTPADDQRARNMQNNCLQGEKGPTSPGEVSAGKAGSARHRLVEAPLDRIKLGDIIRSEAFNEKDESDRSLVQSVG